MVAARILFSSGRLTKVEGASKVFDGEQRDASLDGVRREDRGRRHRRWSRLFASNLHARCWLLQMKASIENAVQRPEDKQSNVEQEPKVKEKKEEGNDMGKSHRPSEIDSRQSMTFSHRDLLTISNS